MFSRKGDVMKIITTIAGILAPISVFAATGLIGNNSGIFVFIFFGFFALLACVQLLPVVFIFTVMVQAIVSVVSGSFAVQKN
jgi:hypothetical protein